MGDIFPAGQLLRELVLALGAALVVGSLAVLVREMRRAPADTRPRPRYGVVVLNLIVGAVLSLWGVASIATGR